MSIDVVVEPSLSSLAHRANDEHLQAQTAAKNWAEHAIAAGEMLIELQKRVEPGGWARWCDENLTFSKGHALLYMRVYFYSDQVLAAGVDSYDAARAVTLGLPSREFKEHHKAQLKAPPSLAAYVLDRRTAGIGWTEIGRETGFSFEVVRGLVDPEWRRKRQESNKRQMQAIRDRRKSKRQEAARAKQALEREELNRLAKKTGGNTSEAYSLVRRLLSELDRAVGEWESPDARASLREAIRHAHKVEEAVVEVLRIERSQA